MLRLPTPMLRAPLMLTCLALLLLSPQALAERPEGPTEGRMGEQLHERMTELRARLLRKRVGLEEARVAEVERVLQKGDYERKALHRAMKESHRTLRQLIESDAEDGQAYEAAVGTLLKTRQRIHALQHGELETLRGMLSPKEMGKLVMVLHRLKKRMQRMHEERRQDRMERGPRGERRGPRGDRRRGRRGGGW